MTTHCVEQGMARRENAHYIAGPTPIFLSTALAPEGIAVCQPHLGVDHGLGDSADFSDTEILDL